MSATKMSEVNNSFSFKIPTENLSKFRQAFEKLSRKSEKLIGKPFILELGKTETVVFQIDQNKKQAVAVRNLSIIGANIPIIEGWQFAASIVHMQTDDGSMINVIKSMLSEEISFPKNFRSEKPHCIHCGINRFRKHSFIVYNPYTQEFKQVGKQCLRDYTGNKDILAIASLLENLLRVKEEYEFNSGNSRREDVYSISCFLTITLACIRAFTYVSSKEARESYESKTATKDHVLRFLNLQGKPLNQYEQEFCSEVNKFIYAEDQTKIDAIIEHFQFDGIDPDTLNDYQYNCYATCQSGIVFAKTAGIAVSMVASYEKELNTKRMNELKGNSSFLCEIPEKSKDIKTFVRATVEVINSFSFNTQYGAIFNVFMLVKEARLVTTTGKGKKAVITETDLNGANKVVCWQTGSSSADLNILLRAINSKKDVLLSGSLKKNDNYKGSGDITYLDRCVARFVDGSE